MASQQRLWHFLLCSASQQRDCHRAIIISGLDSVYIHPVATTLQVVLKAFNNRKHIYAVNLSCSYAVLKARDKLKKVAMGNFTKLIHECAFTTTSHHWSVFFTRFEKCAVRVPLEVLRKGRTSREGSWMQGRDEEEYDALPEEEKEKLMERYRVKLRQMKLRYEVVEADRP